LKDELIAATEGCSVEEEEKVCSGVTVHDGGRWRSLREELMFIRVYNTLFERMYGRIAHLIKIMV